MTVFDLHAALAAPSQYPYPECMAEWRTSSYRVCDEDSDGERCECGKPIWHVFTVEHITGVTLPCIGSTCVKQFDSEFATQAHVLELTVKRAKAAAQRATDAARRAVAAVSLDENEQFAAAFEYYTETIGLTLCKFPKWKGEPWVNVLASDPRYCAWLFKNDKVKGDLKAMIFFYADSLEIVDLY